MSSKEQAHSNDDKARTKQQPSAEDLELTQQQTSQTTAIQKARLDPRSLTSRDVLQLQRMIGNRAVGKLLAQTTQHQPIQKKENKTGLSDNLKDGVETLSGFSMDDVKVHYNSDKPAQLQAHAYAQGADIYLGPGQEKHLHHEAWHVVQQMQGRVEPTMQTKEVQINDDKGLEREADVMGEKARSGATQPKENPLLKSEVKVGSKMVQKRDRAAVVVWDVTHEVIPKEDSMFGDSSEPFENEGIELYREDKVIIDDEDIFQSRRGANQEIRERRENDEAGHLINKWLKLKKVIRQEVYSGRGYVREETIKITDSEEKRRDLTDSSQIDSSDAKGAADKIHNAWGESRGKRKMSTGAWEKWENEREQKEKETSPSWDQIEEGYDVSKQLSNSAPVEHDNYGDGEEQAIFTVRDKESDTPIGIIVIEKRTETEFPDDGKNKNKRWYLRWLIGHPTLKGAGGLLLDKALGYAKQKGGQAVWVESAPSALAWYQQKGFIPLSKEVQEKYNEDFKEGWDSVLMVRELI